MRGRMCERRKIASKINGMAEELFSKAFEVNLIPDVVLYTIMMRGLSEAGRMVNATKLLCNMIAKGVMPDTRCYNVLIKGFCDVGLLYQARSLQLEISQQNQFPNTCTYTIFICGLCRNGLLGEARQIFNDMEKLGCFPSVVTFNALIDGLCKAGKLEEARLMHYKLELGRNPSLFLRLSQGADRVLDSVSLQKMVEKLVDSGLMLKAYKILMQLIDSGAVPLTRTYNTLINGMCKAGQINGAFKLFEELQLKGLSPDSITYATLIDGLQSLDREVDAFKIFEQMNKNGCVPSFSVYKTLMTWSSRRNKITVAYGLWLKYLRSLGEDESLKLVEECFVKGEYENARDSPSAHPPEPSAAGSISGEATSSAPLPVAFAGSVAGFDPFLAASGSSTDVPLSFSPSTLTGPTVISRSSHGLAPITACLDSLFSYF